MFKNRNPLVCILSLVFVATLQIAWAQATLRDEQNRYIRVRQAREHRERQIDSLFRGLGMKYPAKNIIIVVYKQERILELWAKPDTLNTCQLVKKYSFTAFSGELGPKRRVGDMQIPEGFYQILDFNPVSNFHLSMKISYPNESDRILGQGGNLGGEIYIHGSSVTIGCIPIGNAAIEELYLICVDVKSDHRTKIPVYIFPARMDSVGMALLKQQAGNDTALLAFWANLKQGYDLFQDFRQELRYQITDRGQYRFVTPEVILSVEYPWLRNHDQENAIMNRIKAPQGFERAVAPPNSFASWLQNLPLKQGNPPVHLYTGQEKSYQEGHYAVLDIDVGSSDLQQCADAIIRLCAEYLFSIKNFDRINFLITSGDTIKFRRWIRGERPRIVNNQVTWQQSAPTDSSHTSLMGYLNFVFMYAGTYSLSRQLQKVQDRKEMKIGDVFIQGGFPGHAVLVIDMAINSTTSERVFLLAQSYMPAQDIHILKNLSDENRSPWYKSDFSEDLITPLWQFKAEDLKKF